MKDEKKSKQSENNANEKRASLNNFFNESFDEKKNAQFSTSQRKIVDSSSSRSKSLFDFRRNLRLSSCLFEKSKQSISDENENADSSKKKTIDFEQRQR
jgi:hypothetical protein